MTEGERWAGELLAELRAARFAPAGWRRFLGRSFERAAEQRRTHRRAHVQTVLLGALGLTAWATVALGGRPAVAVAGFAWWLLVVVMLDWHLGMIERADGSPLPGIGAANAVTLARAGAVPTLPLLTPELVAAALVAAGASDVLDGWLARARDEVTRLGRWLDGAVDGFVLSVTAAVLASDGLLAPWLAGLVVFRYAVPWLAIGATYFTRAEAPPLAGHVSGRLPGAVLLAGLVLTALAVPGGPALTAAGALAGLGTFAVTMGRTARLVERRASRLPPRLPGRPSSRR
jgi:phosphatidylglycerophosphate synthase